jgi:hypothetical protein
MAISLVAVDLLISVFQLSLADAKHHREADRVLDSESVRGSYSTWSANEKFLETFHFPYKQKKLTISFI